MKNVIQFRNGFINLPASKGGNKYELAMCVASELMQFGYILNQEAIMVLANASKTDIHNFHNEVIKWLKTVMLQLREVLLDLVSAAKTAS